MATKKLKEKSPPAFDMSAIYADTMDSIALRQGFDSSSLEAAHAMSTGLLSMDLILGGGIRPAWFTLAGAEQSAKTTSALTIMAAAIKANVPMIAYADFEGSSSNSLPYITSILKGNGLKLDIDQVFGKKDESTGKWIKRPIVRYRAETVGEKFFDYLSEVLRNLPDKKLINKKWWFVFENNKANKAKIGEFADSSMPKKYGDGLWIPAPDGNLQAIFLVDSYPAMNPSANDEEDANNSLALQARMFSKHLPRVKGRLSQKMVAVIGINQMRAIPMAMYGPKEQEPGGQALRYYSDARLRNTARGSGQPLWPKNFNKEFLEEEKSAEFEGTDKYRYIHSKAIKNKLWIPSRQTWFRIWVEDGSGTARGFDPFFDTMYFLKQTGQLIGKGRKGLSLNLEGLGKGKPLDWYDYKKWVLGDKEAMIAICTKAGFAKPMSLRAFCFKQMQSGVAEKLYVAQKDSKIAEEE
jgi:RecA/RadA recombinase